MWVTHWMQMEGLPVGYDQKRGYYYSHALSFSQVPFLARHCLRQLGFVPSPESAQSLRTTWEFMAHIARQNKPAPANCCSLSAECPINNGFYANWGWTAEESFGLFKKSARDARLVQVGLFYGILRWSSMICLLFTKLCHKTWPICRIKSNI